MTVFWVTGKQTGFSEAARGKGSLQGLDQAVPIADGLDSVACCSYLYKQLYGTKTVAVAARMPGSNFADPSSIGQSIASTTMALNVSCSSSAVSQREEYA